MQYINDPRRLETQFSLSRVSRELNMQHRANFLLAELANPEVEGGLPAAHVERARAIWFTSRRPQDIELAERHLRRALNKQPDNHEANSLMGIIIAHAQTPTGGTRYDEAIPYLMRSRIDDIDARLTLAQIHKLRGNDNLADQFARPVLDFLIKRTENNIDDVRLHTLLAQAYLQIEEFEKAIETLEKAHRSKPSVMYKATLSHCYVVWFRRLERLPPNPLRERDKLDFLLRALDWDQTNVEALSLFVYFMKPGVGETAAQRDEAHKVMLALRGNSPFLHLWMGQKLLDQGKHEEARLEWDLAYKLYPDSPIIANNFAWILTHGHRKVDPRDPKREIVEMPPDLARALAIMNQVIERTPKEYPYRFEFHGTRGTIYLKMGMHEEARADLVFAAQGPKAANDRILQMQLIELYQKLNMPTMVEAHRKRLEEIFRKNSREAQQGTPPGN